MPEPVQFLIDFDWGPNAHRFADAMVAVPDRMAAALRHQLDLYGLEFTTRTIVRARLSGRKEGDKGLYRRSGALAHSMRHQVAGSTLADLALHVFAGGPGAKYALVHEYGAVITPKVERMVVVQRESARYGVRTFMYKRKMLTWRAEYGPHKGKWFSRREVRIPARLEFVKTFKEDLVRRRRFLSAALRAALDVVGGSGQPAPAGA